MEHSTNRSPAPLAGEGPASPLGHASALDDAASALTEAFMNAPLDDEGAFGALCEQWIDTVFASARRTERDRASAEAVTARTLMSCLTRALERRLGRVLDAQNGGTPPAMDTAQPTRRRART